MPQVTSEIKLGIIFEFANKPVKPWLSSAGIPSIDGEGWYESNTG